MKRPVQNKVVNILELFDGNNLVVGLTGTVWSHLFTLPKDVSFGFEFQFTSPGTTSVQIDLEQGNVDLTAAQEALANANYVLAEGVSAIVTITDEDVHIIGFAPVVTQFARLKLLGTGGNDALTALATARMITTKN